jgi:hypothetical protein
MEQVPHHNQTCQRWSHFLNQARLAKVEFLFAHLLASDTKEVSNFSLIAQFKGGALFGFSCAKTSNFAFCGGCISPSKDRIVNMDDENHAFLAEWAMADVGPDPSMPNQTCQAFVTECFGCLFEAMQTLVWLGHEVKSRLGCKELGELNADSSCSLAWASALAQSTCLVVHPSCGAVLRRT